MAQIMENHALLHLETPTLTYRFYSAFAKNSTFLSEVAQTNFALKD